MTCSYDNRLVIDRSGKRILPCCEGMHEYVIDGIIYLGAGKTQAILLRRREPTRKGRQIRSCPFCGAKVEMIE